MKARMITSDTYSNNMIFELLLLFKSSSVFYVAFYACDPQQILVDANEIRSRKYNKITDKVR
jgi:hypothetical protein